MAAKDAKKFDGSPYEFPEWGDTPRTAMGAESSGGRPLFRRFSPGSASTWSQAPHEFFTYHVITTPVLIDGPGGMVYADRNIYTFTNPGWKWSMPRQRIELKVPAGTMFGLSSTDTYGQRAHLFDKGVARKGNEVLLPPSNWKITNVYKFEETGVQAKVNDLFKDKFDTMYTDEWRTLYKYNGAGDLGLFLGGSGLHSQVSQALAPAESSYVKFYIGHGVIIVYNRVATKLSMEFDGYYMSTTAIPVGLPLDAIASVQLHF